MSASCLSQQACALNGAATPLDPVNLNLRRDGLDVNRLLSDLRDIAFSAGSACASGSGRPSHVLRAIGLSDAEARSSIRLGFGRTTTEAELTAAIADIIAAADAQRRSEEHTSELQSLMRISYAVFCMKNKNNYTTSP